MKDLLFDVGNTNVAFALRKDDELVDFDRVGITSVSFLVHLRAQLIEVSNRHKVDRIAICSVNPKACSSLRRTVSHLFDTRVYVCGENLPVTVPTDLDNPDRIGRDRLLACHAAFKTYGSACIVVDMGSAITVDLIDDSGTFRGGSIVPGMASAAGALGRNTALLPTIKPGHAASPLGRDTESAINGGIYFGYVGMIRELIDRIVEVYGKPVEHVVATGGDAPVLYDDVNRFTKLHEALTLEGLALVLAEAAGSKPKSS